MKNSVISKLMFILILVLPICIFPVRVFTQFVNINLSQSPQKQEEPAVRISHKNPDNIVCTWHDSISNAHRVAYSYSSNGGLSWSPRILLDSTLIGGGYVPYDDASVCTDTSGNFYIAVTARHTPYDTNIIVVYKSTDGGATFPTAVIAGPYSGNTGEVRPQITCDFSPTSPNYNTLYLVWRSKPIATNKLAKSTNGGINWSTPVEVPMLGHDGPTLCISPDGQINVVALGGGSFSSVHYVRSTDGGVTFSPNIMIATGPGPYIYIPGSTASFPSIACDISGGPGNGNLYCVFCDSRNNGTPDVFLSRSTDNGANWSNAILINNNLNNSVQFWPWISVNEDGNLAVVFYDNRISSPTPLFDTWLAHSSDGGLTFTNELISSGNSQFLSAIGSYIGVDYWGTRIVPVWTDIRAGLNNCEIFTALAGVHSVSGLATFRDNNQPVPGGFVKVLKYIESTAEIITVDSTIINSNGTYLFNHVPEGEFDIMFYQDDDLLQFVPTYYISTIDWRQATKVLVNQNLTNINCQVYRINNQLNPFQISGLVLRESDMMTTTGISDGIVYAKIGNEFKNFGISSGNGNYNISKLPAGSYSLTVYRMGFDPVTQNVTISNSNLTNINFNLGHPVIGIKEISSEIPKGYSLKQNYPNPFNPVTNIVFGLPKAGMITIEIYDILGRVVSTIVNENLKAGTYSVKWDGESFTSGVYFYRIKTAEYSETRKMIFLK